MSESQTESQPFLTGKRLTRFVALQAALVPRSQEFTPKQIQTGQELVNTLVGNMPAANQRKLGVFLLLIDILAILRGLRSFRNLSHQKQHALLHWLFDCPISLLRKGFWGLNSVAKLSVYGQRDLYAEIGYAPRPNPEDS